MSPVPFYLLTILINLYQVESNSDYQHQQTQFPEYHPILNTQYYELNGTDIGNSSAYYQDTASSYQQPLKYYQSSHQYYPADYSSYVIPSKTKDEETAGVQWRLSKRHPSFTKRRSKKQEIRRDPTHSRSHYLPSRRRHYNKYNKKKTKWIDRQGGFFDDVFEEFSLDGILPELPVPDFLLRGLDDYDVDDDEEPEDFDDLFDFRGGGGSEDNEDELEPEESYHRPWALGGAGSYERHPMRFGSYGGMRDRVHSPSKRRVFGRHGMKSFFGKGFKFLIALLLLPLLILLLFTPIPIVVPITKGKNSRNDDLSSPPSSASENSSIHDLSRRFLSSEDCIERISCEIKRFQYDNAPESQSFSRFIRFVRAFGTSSFFPSFLVRVARGYTQKAEEDGDDNQCAKFTCENLQGFLGKK